MFNQKKIKKSGSINIPIAMRREMGLQPNDVVDVEMKDGAVVLSPVTPRCQFCENNMDEMTKIFGKYICKDCASLAYDVLKEGQANE